MEDWDDEEFNNWDECDETMERPQINERLSITELVSMHKSPKFKHQSSKLLFKNNLSVEKELFWNFSDQEDEDPETESEATEIIDSENEFLDYPDMFSWYDEYNNIVVTKNMKHQCKQINNRDH